ncbi:MAG: hypothetical protein WBA97_15085 [Actinophytocola sp.]|uniref:hypothetical protein n=1 Tax=Actinophytocola sp. TaxID=1872138 RepID=UPI003C758D2E
MADVMTYRLGSQGPGDLQRIVDDLLASVPGDPELADEIRARNVDPDMLGAGSITVSANGAGLDPATVALVIAFVAPPVIDIWKDLLLPRIRRRWGINAVGPSVEEEAGRE